MEVNCCLCHTALGMSSHHINCRVPGKVLSYLWARVHPYLCPGVCCLHEELLPRRTYQAGVALSCTSTSACPSQASPQIAEMNFLSHRCLTLPPVSGTDHFPVGYRRGCLTATDLVCTWISLEFVKCVLLKKRKKNLFANICT